MSLLDLVVLLFSIFVTFTLYLQVGSVLMSSAIDSSESDALSGGESGPGATVGGG